ncbi:MAG TPA: phosphate-starvation-inducible PsiE family protein [Coriobacteriia bacterium]|nr:phosphate-starvation-inducible PsiE family protein [Coriobacteriia bacterium]
MAEGQDNFSTKGIQTQLNRFVLAVEVVVSAALVVIASLLVISLGVQLLGTVTDGLEFGRAEFTRLVSTALEIFIVIELFRIALAYMNNRDVIPTVLEAAFVAIARKFVVFEPTAEYYLQTAIGLAALLVALAISWWLLRKSRVVEPE